MDALKKFIKNPGNAFKALIDLIIRTIKFFGSVLGQIVGWLIIIILVIIIIYVIIDVISSFIADILGIDQDAGIDQTADYEIIQQLVTEGYDVVMPPEELVDYYAYEYAVLMDLARNIEEAGVFFPIEDDQAYYDPAFLSKEEWAQLCADTFVTFDNQQFTAGIKGKYTDIKTNSQTALDAGIKKANDGGSLQDVTGEILGSLPTATSLGIDDAQREYLAEKLAVQAMAEAEDAKPSNEMSKEELIYKSVTSDSTGETSLMPYIVVERPVNIYKYKFMDLSLSGNEATKDYSQIFRTSKGKGYGKGSSPRNFGNGSQGATWQYINEYIEPLEVNSLLNGNNISLHKKNPPGTKGPIDLNQPFGESIYYSTQDNGTTTYEIPLKTIADRYMPKAVLFSSWYLLKQDEPTAEGEKLTAELILEEIRRIYDKACLDGETVPETNWLLVKDVLAAAKTGNGKTELEKVFGRTDFSTQNATNEYAFMDGKATELIYQRYNANFDSRNVVEKSKTETGATVNNNANNSQVPVQTTLFETKEQKFEGTLKEELIDDLRLVITHHVEKKPGFINDIQYEKYIEDFEKILEDDLELFDLSTLSSSNKPKEYIIYRRDANGEYVIECEEMLKNEGHHNQIKSGTTHQQKYEHEFNSDECYEYVKTKDAAIHKDPYSSSCDVNCFVPYIKVMFGSKEIGERNELKVESNKEYKIKSEVTAKVTAITIIDSKSVEYLYRVDSKEIEDIGSLTNNKSFMKFDRYDMEMTNFSDWDEHLNSADNAEERTFFVVTDAFEAVPIKITLVPNLNSLGEYDGDFINNANSDYVTAATPKTHKQGASARNQIRDDLKERISNRITDSMMREFLTNHSYDLEDLLSQYNVEFYGGGDLAVVKKDKNQDGTFTDEALTPPSNAAPVAGCSALPPYYTDVGESDYISNATYIKVKGNNIQDVINRLNDLEVEFNKKGNQIESDIDDFANGVLTAASYISSRDIYYTNSGGERKQPTRFGFNINIDVDLDDAAVVYPVEKRVVTFTQTVKQRKMTMYLPRYAETWSSEKSITNRIETNGTFDPECGAGSGGYFQLIPRTSAGGGVKNISVGITNYWRTNFYAPHFAVVRENDVLAMISEWESAGEKGHFAAYTYIRDLYSLIHTAKSVNDSEGKPYVNQYSYEYMYIPDEILYFDESVTDKAFWLERILATAAQDSIKKEENATMRNRRSVKTWQILEYDKYEECYEVNANGEKTGVVNVYGLWPLGGYLGRSLYAFEANSSESANNKILSWGAFIGPGVHSGVDLYGRGNATRLYNNIYSNGEPKIKAEFNGGNVILTDGTNYVLIDGTKNDDSLAFGDENVGVGTDGNHGENQTEPTVEEVKNSGNINGTKGQGAYMSTTVPININGTVINFAGSTSATYGYELYRLTKAYGDGEKAEKELKETIETEMLNTPVVAIAPGIVKEVKGGARPGFMVVIQHAEGVKTNYLHMKRWPEVQVGEYVGAGTILGYEGTTGNSGGYHVHHEINTNKGGTPTADGIKSHPIPQLYPFFNPFYYDEKAKDANYALESEYLSIVRTIFPYGAIVSGNDQVQKFNYTGKNDGILKQVENDSDGEIIMKNYTPTLPLMSLAELVQDPNDQKERLIERIGKNMLSSTQTDYSGEGVIALPQYFDEEFIKEVLSNGGHMLTQTQTP